VNSILLIPVIVIAAAGLGMLVLVITGIHSEERHLNLPGPPRTRAEHLTRRVLNVYVSQPGALHVLAGRHASTPAAAPPPAPPSDPKGPYAANGHQGAK
jgi:hypothetical protein